MPIIKITSKRQATLPKALCDEMQVQPGDSLLVERVAEQNAWIMRPVEPSCTPSWMGSLRRYAVGKCHNMDTIRQCIEKARSRESK